MLPGILGLPTAGRSNELALLMASNHDENGNIASNHSYLLDPFVPPIDGVLEYFSLSDQLRIAEADLLDFKKTRIHTSTEAAVTLIRQLRASKSAAKAAIMQHIKAAELFKDGGEKQNFLDAAPVPIAFFYESLFNDEDLIRYLDARKPSGFVEIGDADFDKGVTERREVVAKLESGLETLANALAVLTPPGAICGCATWPL